MAGIRQERPRGGNHGGKDSREQERLRARIIEAKTRTAPADATHWSCRSMASAMGATRSRVWGFSGLKPYLIWTFKLSRYPQFARKLVDVVALYLDPPENATVSGFDKKSSIQALGRIRPVAASCPCVNPPAVRSGQNLSR